MIDLAARIYLVCLAVAVLFFSLFPPTYVNVSPTEIRPIETRVERVIEGGPNVTNIQQAVEVNVRDIVDLEARVNVIADKSDQKAAEFDRRITNANDYAVQAVTQADQLRKQVAAGEEQSAKERKEQRGRDYILFGAWLIAWVVAGVALARTLRRPGCNGRHSSGNTTPTSAGTPTKR